MKKLRAIVVPSLRCAPSGLVSAMRHCGLSIRVVESLATMERANAAILVVNVVGLGPAETWGVRLHELIEAKREAGLSGLATLVVEPTPSCWAATGGWTSEVDAYITNTQPAQRFVELIQSLLLSDV